MSHPSPKKQEPAKSPYDDEGKFTPSYQNSKVPWLIYLMWGIFATAAIIYLVRFAIPDFIRWW